MTTYTDWDGLYISLLDHNTGLCRNYIARRDLDALGETESTDLFEDIFPAMVEDSEQHQPGTPPNNPWSSLHMEMCLGTSTEPVKSSITTRNDFEIGVAENGVGETLYSIYRITG